MINNETVQYRVENQIATITLNRPKSLNSMNEELVSALSARLEEIKTAEGIRVVILTGSGRAFCAGGDLAHLATLTDVISAKAFVAKVGALAAQIMTLNQPVIAMVNGVAAGAGFNLALSADIVCCSQSARFAQSFAKVGLIPDCAGMYLLPRIIGVPKAKELMFTADIIDAQMADRLGLIHHIFEDGALAENTYALAEKLKQSAPLALSMIKKTLNAADTLTFADLLEHEATLQSLCMQTADHKEGIAAFMEKRSPIFTGK